MSAAIMAGVSFTEVDLAKLPLEEKAVKTNNVLVVPFKEPIRIQTSLLTATSPLCTPGEDGSYEIRPSITARASGSFLVFLKKFEDAILKAAHDGSNKWWPKQKFEAEFIDNAFRRYMKSADVFKIRVDSSLDPVVYDESGSPVGPEVLAPGQKFWCVLEASRVVLGKTEFGVVWRLVQAMHKPAPACVVVPPKQTDKLTDPETSEFD